MASIQIFGISDPCELKVGEWVQTTLGGAHFNVEREDEQAWALFLMNGQGTSCIGQLHVSPMEPEGIETLAIGWLQAIDAVEN